MFKTWALILMVSTADGQVPMEKARYESLEQCMMQVSLALRFSTTKQNHDDLASNAYCYRLRNGEMYKVKDYLGRQINQCLRDSLCHYANKPAPVKRQQVNAESAIDLTHRNKIPYVFAN